VTDPSIGSQPALGAQLSMPGREASRAVSSPTGWAEVLDSFETDLRNAEWLLSHGVGESEVLGGGWTSPEGLGPIPVEYCEWVRSLLDRQALMYSRLVSATSRSRQRGTYVDSPSGHAAHGHSRFIDARA
jgi:hypothetical protein